MSQDEPVEGAARVEGRQVLLGALLWALFALAHVLTTPVVVDETALSAQILTGAVTYPDGHPHAVFHLQAFSLPNHLSAAILALTDDLELVSRVRNFLVVFLSGFAPFLAALVVTRRPLVGFAAGALVLTDCVYRFQGVYPTFLFPTFYSHGHVGAYTAVVTVALVSGGFLKSGALLLGLMPGIHPLLGALVWGWAALLVLSRRRVLTAASGRASGAAFAVGALVSAASWAWARSLAPAAVTEGPYALAAGGELVRSHFIELTDPHRRMPPPDSSVFLFGYVANTVAFVALAVTLWTAGAGARRIAGFVALAWVAVWGSHALELALGELPGPLLTAMPYRLSNVSAILLVPLGVSALFVAARRAGRGTGTLVAWLVVGLLLAAGLAAADEWLRPLAYRRALRLVGGIGLLGGAFGLGLVARGSALRRLACAGALAVLGVVFLLQREKSGFQGAELLGAAAFAGAVCAVVGPRLSREHEGVSAAPLRPLVAVAALLCALATVRSSHAEESSLVSDFDREVVRWLDENAGPDELLVGPLIPRTQLQVKTGHPVLLELGTLWLMPYLPDVSSVIGRLTADVYGIDYADRDALERAAPDGYLGQHDEVWKDVWRYRSRDAWAELGERWDFRLVVAPVDWELDLVPRIASEEWALYEVPRP